MGRVPGRRTCSGVPAAERSDKHTWRLVLHVRLRARKRLLYRFQARLRERAHVEVRCRIYRAEEESLRKRTRSRSRDSVSGFPSSASTSKIPGLTAFPVAA